jgi:hypothetical protein
MSGYSGHFPWSHLQTVHREQPNRYRRVLFPEVSTCDSLLFLNCRGCYSPTAPGPGRLPDEVQFRSVGGKSSESPQCPHADPSPAFALVIK